MFEPVLLPDFAADEDAFLTAVLPVLFAEEELFEAEEPAPDWDELVFAGAA